MSYDNYKQEVREGVVACLRDMGCQPVLFAGAGLGRRYFGAPSWDELLEMACSSNSLIKKEYTYYRQAYSDQAAVAEALIDPFHEWAWGQGRKRFPPEMFADSVTKDMYLKHFVSTLLERMQPSGISQIRPKALRDELKLIQGIRPNSIITTNYDQFLETCFPEYTPIIGQTIIKTASAMIGEIFKIHGCISRIDEIVLTSSDYKGWNDRKKYLSAKLLTYFLEHPVLIVGYSANDANVLAILRDIDEILASRGDIVENIYYVIYDEKADDGQSPSKEVLLDLGNGSSMRVNAIYTSDLSWVYQAFAASEGLENVNPKILRALMSRTYDLVRHDIPKATIEVDYSTLEQAVQNESELPKLLGITAVSDPEQFNAAYPYTLTTVGKQLGFTGWHDANKLLNRLIEETGINLKESDNQYHIAVKSGESCSIHKYSNAMIELLKKIRDGEGYEIKLRKRKAASSKSPKASR